MPCLSVAEPKSQSMTSVMAAELSASERGAAPDLLDVLGVADERADGGAHAQEDAAAAQERHVEPPPRSSPHGAGG